MSKVDTIKNTEKLLSKELHMNLINRTDVAYLQGKFVKSKSLFDNKVGI